MKTCVSPHRTELRDVDSHASGTAQTRSRDQVTLRQLYTHRCTALKASRGNRSRPFSYNPIFITEIITSRYLIGEDAYILVERLGRTDVAAGDSRLSRSTSRQLALLEDERQQREQWMPEKRTVITVSMFYHQLACISMS